MGCYPWSMLGKSRPGLLLLFTNREYSAAVRHHANFRGGGWWWWCWCPCSQLGDIGISITPDTRRLISESKNPILAILQRDSIDRQKYPCSFVPKRFLLWPRNSENFWSECVRIERRVWKQELLPRRQSLAWTWWQLLLGPQSYETDTSYCCLSFLFFFISPRPCTAKVIIWGLRCGGLPSSFIRRPWILFFPSPADWNGGSVRWYAERFEIRMHQPTQIFSFCFNLFDCLLRPLLWTCFVWFPGWIR